MAIGLALASCLPVLVARYPQMSDYPAHLARYAVMLDAGRSADLARYYGFSWAWTGNLGVDLLIRPFAALFGLEGGGRVITGLIPPLTGLALIAVDYTLHRRVTVASFLAMAFVWSPMMLIGLLNFALGQALALWGFALWVWLDQRRARGVGRGDRVVVPPPPVSLAAPCRPPTWMVADASGDATLGFDWGGNNWSWNSGLTVLANTWSFVSLVVTPNNATISVYSTNGITRSVDTAAMPSININGSTWIGGDGNDSATSLRTYNGQIADVAIFNRALSNAELDSLADVGGVITLVHVNGSQLTWNHGALLQSTSLTGPWTPVSGASSPYNLTPTGPGKFYRVQN